MRLVVIDASVTLAGHLRDEDSAAARNFFSDIDSCIVHVPAIWALEVANGLLVAYRRKRLSAEDADRILEGLAAYEFHVDRQVNLRAARNLLALAGRHQLTVYDVSYLELALRLNAGLATLDGSLSRAAGAAGVTLAIER